MTYPTSSNMAGPQSTNTTRHKSPSPPLPFKRDYCEGPPRMRRRFYASEFQSNAQADNTLPPLTGLGIQLQYPPTTSENHTTAFHDDYCKLIASDYYPESQMGTPYDLYHQAESSNGLTSGGFRSMDCDPSTSDMHFSGQTNASNRFRLSSDVVWPSSTTGLNSAYDHLDARTSDFMHHLPPSAHSGGDHYSKNHTTHEGLLPHVNLSGNTAMRDINMYEPTYLGQGGSLCVNPADVMADVYDTCIDFQANASSSASSSSGSHSPRTISSTREHLSIASLDQDTQGSLPESMDTRMDFPTVFDDSRSGLPIYDFSKSRKRGLDGSDYAPSPPPPSSPSTASSPLPTPAKNKVNVRIPRTRIARAVPKLLAEIPSEDIKTEESGPVQFGTPVLDAHRGISLEDLEAKAERYRLRNPGMAYDKRWLLSFAGKLTARGELLDEYRCYIIGCSQTNKRRDHILIHIGAHLDQRPFRCSYCPSRFLRKNECKRHELGHVGTRPFACDLCASDKVTFVRQDLLKRHLKRTHNIDATKSSRKKKKTDDVDQDEFQSKGHQIEPGEAFGDENKENIDPQDKDGSTSKKRVTKKLRRTLES